MVVGPLPDPGTLADEVDWSRLSHAFGPAAPETPAKLAGLVSGDARAVTAALGHLWDDLLHQGSLCSATPAAALCVAAVLGDPRGRESLTCSHRSRLLAWLADVAFVVTVRWERQLQEWSGSSAARDRNPHVGDIRAMRPALLRGVLPWVSDPDPSVTEAALLAAVHLLDAPELMSFRDALAPQVRTVLAVSSVHGHRAAAIAALEAWGEEVGSLRGPDAPAEDTDDTADAFWSADRGPLDEPPF
ncbi:hypothetical protein [Streptomyces sp. NPDC090022]|uniref:hypothetical protein n=1 Tax=Streptomyces sp. NPDC090022 TaxID=3365920 RepID=UPI0038017F52